MQSSDTEFTTLYDYIELLNPTEVECMLKSEAAHNHIDYLAYAVKKMSEIKTKQGASSDDYLKITEIVNLLIDEIIASASEAAQQLLSNRCQDILQKSKNKDISDTIQEIINFLQRYSDTQPPNNFAPVSSHSNIGNETDEQSTPSLTPTLEDDLVELVDLYRVALNEVIDDVVIYNEIETNKDLIILSEPPQRHGDLLITEKIQELTLKKRNDLKTQEINKLLLTLSNYYYTEYEVNSEEQSKKDQVLELTQICCKHLELELPLTEEHVNLLLASNSHVLEYFNNTTTSKTSNPLTTSNAENGNNSIIEELLAFRSQQNSDNVLLRAIRQNKQEVLDWILAKLKTNETLMKQLSQKDHSGSTALHLLAVENPNTLVHVLKLLPNNEDRKAAINFKNTAGETVWGIVDRHYTLQAEEITKLINKNNRRLRCCC